VPENLPVDAQEGGAVCLARRAWRVARRLYLALQPHLVEPKTRRVTVESLLDEHAEVATKVLFCINLRLMSYQYQSC
jgi:hypothetical protein